MHKKDTERPTRELTRNFLRKAVACKESDESQRAKRIEFICRMIDESLIDSIEGPSEDMSTREHAEQRSVYRLAEGSLCLELIHCIEKNARKTMHCARLLFGEQKTPVYTLDDQLISVQLLSRLQTRLEMQEKRTSKSKEGREVESYSPLFLTIKDFSL